MAFLQSEALGEIRVYVDTSTLNENKTHKGI